MNFQMILKEKERDQIKKLNLHWLMQIEGYRSRCVQALNLCIEACSLLEEVKTRTGTFAWLIGIESPLVAHEIEIVRTFLYEYLYA